jgi:hypothetical protein
VVEFAQGDKLLTVSSTEEREVITFGKLMYLPGGRFGGLADYA